jgi:hypothetical protein
MISKLYKLIEKLQLHFHLKSYLRILPTPSAEAIAADWCHVFNEGQNRTILYLGVKYDYGNPARGLSYEEYNFLNTFKQMNDVTVVRLDIYTLYYRYGRKAMNDAIKEACIHYSITDLFYLLYLDVIDYSLIASLSNDYGIKTHIWLFDDDKRYLETQDLVSSFDIAITTLEARHYWRLSKGINSSYAQFAANHYMFRSFNIERDIDVLFIGQNFGNRKQYVEYLRSHNIKVEAFGNGWPNGGRVTQSRMLSLLNRAKIVLNFSSSYGHPELKHLKGRVFEIPATGAFLLTEECTDLEKYFDVGEDVERFSDEAELLEKVQYYLANKNDRVRIAKKGKEKVIENYTVELYLRNIFALNHMQ